MREQLRPIIENLIECYNGTPWYGISLTEKLNSISWEKVNEKQYGSKSIAILVQHIINWRIFVIEKLKDNLAYDLIIDGPTDWTNIHINNEQEWHTLNASLQETQTELLGLLKDANDSILSKKVPGKKYVFKSILTSISQHDIYHLGQIAMLNAEANS